LEPSVSAPKVSVVIPAFNGAWCIQNALDCLATQTFHDFEVVVVNDGSTDATETVIRNYVAQGRLGHAHLISQQNKGLGGARNTGIRYSRGEFVAFLDQDDVWRPNRLARVMETFAPLPSTTGLVCHDELVTRNDEVVRVNRYGPAAEDMYERLLFHGSCLSPSAVTVRRDLLEEVDGFSEDPRVHFIEDYDLWLRLSRLTRFFFLHEPLGVCRLHEFNFSSRVEYNLQNTLAVLNKHLAPYDASRETTVRLRVRRRKQVAFRQAARHHIVAGDLGAAWRNLLVAMRLYPLAPKAWAVLALLLARLPHRFSGDG
jgi:glycosyltransferase involved in cell wall biosynthesis